MNFNIRPYIAQDRHPVLPSKLTGTVHRETLNLNPNQTLESGQHASSVLKIDFSPIQTQAMQWPDSAQNPQRLDGLWESTCFECFIGLHDKQSYIELNVSPSGNWQAYLFSSYRKSHGMCDEVHLTSHIEAKPNELKSISYHVDIGHPDFVTTDWKISVSAVLALENGDLGYYASRHPHAKPDFHLGELRDINLPFASTD